MAVGPQGRIYVAGEDAVLMLDTDGQELDRHGVDGAPTAMAVTEDGGLLLALRDHVTVVAPSGEAKAWDTLGEKAYLTSIAARDGEVYVADAGRRQVLRYDENGEVLGRIGAQSETQDLGAPGFIVPSACFDLAFDPQGALWVVNPGRHGLENYRPDGTLTSSWYRPSMKPEGFCGCCNPTHIAFRHDCMLITAEKGIVRVKVYRPDQTMLGFVAGPASFGVAPGNPFAEDVEAPIADLAIDAQDRILVLDNKHGVVRVFEEKDA